MFVMNLQGASRLCVAHPGGQRRRNIYYKFLFEAVVLLHLSKTARRLKCRAVHARRHRRQVGQACGPRFIDFRFRHAWKLGLRQNPKLV
jgi:hypothetical protein